MTQAVPHLQFVENLEKDCGAARMRADKGLSGKYLTSCLHNNFTVMTKNQINRAIKHLGIEIVGARGDGYFYFCDLESGAQVGESVLICYLNHCTLQEWVEYAEQVKEYLV